jgi:hypothetical protein
MDNIENDKDKPFTQGYVLRITAKHMRRFIDISIRKTTARIAEFDGDQVKSSEVFRTLTILHGMRKQLDEFQLIHKEAFKAK